MPLTPPSRRWGRGNDGVLAGGVAANTPKKGLGDGAAPKNRGRAQEFRNLSAAEASDQGDSPGRKVAASTTLREARMESERNFPFELEGWLEFNRLKWNVQPCRVHYDTGSSAPALDAVLYLDRRGRIVQPRLNSYLPVRFRATPTQKRYRLDRQWLQAATSMAHDMHERGLRGTVSLSPQVTDARPWQWAGFRLGSMYTYHLDLPFDLEGADPQVGKAVAKAERTGYRVESARDMALVLTPLLETEARQEFHYSLSLRDLQKARDLLGEEHLRAYVCYAPDGRPASSRVVLCAAGGRAIDWVAGTCTEDLHSGATQLTIETVLRDLQDAGATGFDFAGANIPSVASAKANWGGRLVLQPTITTYNLRTLAQWFLGWYQYRHGPVKD